MMLFDHGALRADGTVNRNQRPEADVNIEFQSNSELADESRDLAFLFKAASDAYATDYPASVGPHMTNTDSTPFMNIVPSISLRENERGAHRSGPRNLDSGLSEISIVFQAAVPKPVVPKYTASGVRRPSEL